MGWVGELCHCQEDLPGPLIPIFVVGHSGALLREPLMSRRFDREKADYALDVRNGQGGERSKICDDSDLDCKVFPVYRVL